MSSSSGGVERWRLTADENRATAARQKMADVRSGPRDSASSARSDAKYFAQSAEAVLKTAGRSGWAAVAGSVAKGLGNINWLVWLIDGAVEAGVVLGKALARDDNLIRDDLLRAQAIAATLVFAAAGYRQKPAVPHRWTKGASGAQLQGFLKHPKADENAKVWSGYVLEAESEIFAALARSQDPWETYKELVIAQWPPAADLLDDDVEWQKEWAEILGNVPLKELELD